MKLAKIALTPPIVAISVALFAAQVASGAIYVDVASPGGADGQTFDGRSWSTAFTGLNDAINYLREELPAGGDPTICIAKGIYTPTGASGSTTGNDVTNANFRILGGYRAASDDDTVRDPEKYQTIISGSSAASSKSATWTRKWPEPGVFGYKTESAGKVLEQDEAGNYRIRYPAFTYDYDFFVADSQGGGRLIVCAKGSSGTVDGLRFICCQRPASSTAGVLAMMSGAGDIVVTNCVFAGNSAQGGALNDAAGTSAGFRTVVDCVFFGNRPSWGSGWAINSSGNTIVTNCAFLGNGRTSETGGTMLSMDTFGCRVVGCVITHNTIDSGSLISGNGVIENCVITNNGGNFAEGVVPGKLISLDKTKNRSSGEIRNCLVAGNLWEFCAAPNSAYTLVGTGSTTYDNNPLVINTVFRGNRMLAQVNTLDSGSSCAVGLFGASSVSKSTWADVVGCAFISNEVAVADAPADADVYLSRGILSYASIAVSTQIGVANCTFFGPADGVFDIVQVGLHNEPMNIVNCVFSDDDYNALTSPFLSTEALSTMNVIDCAIKNMSPLYEPTFLASVSGTTYDPIPFAAADFPVGSEQTLRPAARTPDIRTSCDLAVNSPTWPASVCFRSREAGAAWQPLSPKRGKLATGERTPLADADGDERVFGGTTRGALQALTDVAESGFTLTLRANPILSGSFSVPANQAVASGAAITPVTAAPADDFGGWRDETGALVSRANPLVIDSLGRDMVLTADFAVQTVSVTFDLGEHATFDETGEHTYVTNVAVQTEFPLPPAFTADRGWMFVKWAETPGAVPFEDIVVKAKVITTSKRTFYVAPVASGTGDGSSWENATDDFVAAYEDAGICVGEVKLKGGVYRLTSIVRLLSNVEIVGGCDGVETVFTGDVNGDNVWKALDKTEMGPVWTGAVFNEPNPEGTDAYWTARSADARDDVWYGFQSLEDEVATNAVFRNVVFTGFARSAVQAEGPDTDGLRFEKCRFLANGTERNGDYQTVGVVIGSNVDFDDCEFRGNYKVYATTFSTEGNTNRIADCVFRDNTDCSLSFTLSCETNVFVVSNCVFRRNYAAGTTVLAISSTKHCPGCSVADCTIDFNRPGGALIGVSASNQRSGDYWPTPVLEIARCSVSNNVRESADGGPMILSAYGRYYWSSIVDCYFGGNVYVNSGAGKIASLVCNASYNKHCFIDCTFENNTVRSTASDGSSSLFYNTSGYAAQHIFGCTIAHNGLEAESDDLVATFFNSAGLGSTGFQVKSSVVDEEGGQTLIRSTSSVSSGSFRCCTLTGYDESRCPQKIPTFTDCVFTSAMVAAKSEIGPNGLRALPLRGETPVRMKGLPLWKSTAEGGIYYYYDNRKASKQFVQLGSGGESTPESAAKVGVGLTVPPIVDAWGQVRRYRNYRGGDYADDPRVDPSALKAPTLGMMLLVR